MYVRAQVIEKKSDTKIGSSAPKAQDTDFFPSTSTAANRILPLQRTIGNKAVRRLIKSGAIHAKQTSMQRNVQRFCSDDPEQIKWAALEGVSGSGGRLPYLEKIQASFGAYDVTDVQAHVGGAAGKASDAIGAKAYATGNHVAFKEAPDLQTAAHEAAHVVQQKSGVQLQMGIGQIGDVYERHADEVADRVVQGGLAEDLLSSLNGREHSTEVQMKNVQFEWGNPPTDEYNDWMDRWTQLVRAGYIIEYHGQGDNTTYSIYRTNSEGEREAVVENIPCSEINQRAQQILEGGQRGVTMTEQQLLEHVREYLNFVRENCDTPSYQTFDYFRRTDQLNRLALIPSGEQPLPEILEAYSTAAQRVTPFISVALVIMSASIAAMSGNVAIALARLALFAYARISQHCPEEYRVWLRSQLTENRRLIRSYARQTTPPLPESAYNDVTTIVRHMRWD